MAATEVITMKPRFDIGTTFIRYSSKQKVPETITDILTTTNSAGEVVKIRYVTKHQFCGQSITDVDVCDATISRSISKP